MFKRGFTLAEGPTHRGKSNTPPLVAKAAFTLAEVLITLAVIGVVAALTLPTLIANINTKVETNQKKVTEAKLIQGLNMLDLHGGINNTYSSTAEFVKELGKYMKITAVCDGTTKAFTECIPYNEIKYFDGNEEKTVDISRLNTSAALGKGNLSNGAEFMDPVVLVLGDGIPVIFTYNKNCVSDPDSIMDKNKSIHPCVAGIYDLNGSRLPNRYGKDLIAFNGATINIVEINDNVGGGDDWDDEFFDDEPENDSAVIATIGGYNIISQATQSFGTPCLSNMGDFEEITTCPFGNQNDYWVGALVACREMGGHLPSPSELTEIAKKVYPNVASYQFSESTGVKTNGRWDYDIANSLGIDSSTCLWAAEESNEENNGDRSGEHSMIRCFSSDRTYASMNIRDNNASFICLEGEF
ncbi:type II secretion system protein [bacterium]|nr:type II secretion system protein [bacterium]